MSAKRVLGWAMLALVTVTGGCAVLLDRWLADGCTAQVFNETSSPDGKLNALVYQVDCGATSGFSRQVLIARSSTKPTDSSALGRGFFAISLGSEVDPSLSMKDSLVDINWLAADRLEIAYPAGSRLHRSADRQEGVDITYRIYGTPHQGAGKS